MNNHAERLFERQMSENLDDLVAKRDRLSFQRLSMTSSDLVASLHSHISENWEDTDAWMSLAEIYERKQV